MCCIKQSMHELAYGLNNCYASFCLALFKAHSTARLRPKIGCSLSLDSMFRDFSFHTKKKKERTALNTEESAKPFLSTGKMLMWHTYTCTRRRAAKKRIWREKKQKWHNSWYHLRLNSRHTITGSLIGLSPIPINGIVSDVISLTQVDFKQCSRFSVVCSCFLFGCDKRTDYNNNNNKNT